MPIFLFIVGKFVAYWAYCALAPRWLAFAETRPLKFGFLHALLRMAFGFGGFYAIVVLMQALDRAGLPGPAVYALSFIPVRLVEWLALFLVIAYQRQLKFNGRASYWILGGVAVSCLCDGIVVALHDAGIFELNFC